MSARGTRLVIQSPTSGYARLRRGITIDCATSPAPTIQAYGLAGDRWYRHRLECMTMATVPAPPADLAKPPYRVPTMAEIAAIPPNGLRVISTFSGCGGSCLGFRMAGYRVLWANEFIPAAAEVYRLNAPTTLLDTSDIRALDPATILQATGLRVGEIDVLEGSPPCASFSTSGRRSKSWGKVRSYSETAQRSDDLFFEFARLLAALQPRAFIAENVSGLVRGVAKGYFKLILAALRDCGYRVEARLLDAQWLGVPQMRSRIIFQGIRNDLNRAPAWPTPLPYRYSVREALPWLDGPVIHDTGGIKNYSRGDVTDGPAATVLSADSAAHHVLRSDTALRYGNKAPFDSKGQPIPLDGPVPTVLAADSLGLAPYQFEVLRPAGEPLPPERRRMVETPTGEAYSLEGTAIEREWRLLRPGEKSDRYFNLGRAATNGPSRTVTALGGCAAGFASVTHPLEARKFTIAELKRLCAFPDDFALTGSYAQQWERLGRAVPPVMMAAIARALAPVLLEPRDAG